MTRMLPPGSPEFSGLFDTFQHTAYRLERLQEYHEPTEADAINAFASGREPAVYPGKHAWMVFVSGARAAGKVMQRVHAVTEPLSSYLQYEIGWSYGHNVAVGEDVRILAAPWLVGLPELDYWLFDSSVLARIHYAEDGQMTGVEIVEEPRAIVSACYWRDAALHAAVPYREYLRTAQQQLRQAS